MPLHVAGVRVVTGQLVMQQKAVREWVQQSDAIPANPSQDGEIMGPKTGHSDVSTGLGQTQCKLPGQGTWTLWWTGSVGSAGGRKTRLRTALNPWGTLLYPRGHIAVPMGALCCTHGGSLLYPRGLIPVARRLPAYTSPEPN